MSVLWWERQEWNLVDFAGGRWTRSLDDVTRQSVIRIRRVGYSRARRRPRQKDCLRERACARDGQRIRRSIDYIMRVAVGTLNVRNYQTTMDESVP